MWRARGNPEAAADRVTYRTPSHVDRRQVSLDPHIEGGHPSGKRKATDYASPHTSITLDTPGSEPLTPVRLTALLPDMPRCMACLRASGTLLRQTTRKLLPCIAAAAVLLCLFGASPLPSREALVQHPRLRSTMLVPPEMHFVHDDTHACRHTAGAIPSAALLSPTPRAVCRVSSARPALPDSHRQLPDPPSLRLARPRHRRDWIDGTG